MRKINILAIPGSLRPDSSSNSLLKIIANMIPENLTFEIYSGIGTLPHFDSSETPPDSVHDFREKIGAADGVLICTPEYAFGVPGSLKNALDWTVSSGEFIDKPVALITASSQGEKGHESLQHTLTAISSKQHPSTSLLISFIRAKVKDGKIIDEETEKLVRRVVNNFSTMLTK
ncbi:MAG TPA: NADPH-dependent FMN reductase [Cyclobacteriaceae bacterium]|nr:NADPH-dependent FMN reductase [Cyclobacteriaceae bacterium]